MKDKIYIILLFTVIASFLSCGRGGNKTLDKQIVLRVETLVPLNDKLTLSEIQKSGKQELKTLPPQTNTILVENISAGQRKLLVLEKKKGHKIPFSAAPGDTIRIKIVSSSLSRYEIAGSYESKHLAEYEHKYVESKQRMDSVMSFLYESTRDGSYGQMNKKADSIHQKTIQQLKTKTSSLVRENPGFLGNILILNRYLGNQRIFPPEENPGLFDSTAKTINRNFPSHPLARQFFQQVQQKIKEIRQKQNRNARLQPGNKAPEIAGKNIDGKTVNLEDYRGHPVLLLFWSVKDEGSVKKLNRLKPVYRRYQSKGFKILALSVDPDKNMWKKVARDTLYPWKNIHTPGWLSSPQAQKYALDSLPSSFLIDPKGYIAGKNLNPSRLSGKLDSLIP